MIIIIFRFVRLKSKQINIRSNPSVGLICFRGAFCISQPITGHVETVSTTSPANLGTTHNSTQKTNKPTLIQTSRCDRINETLTMSKPHPHIHTQLNIWGTINFYHVYHHFRRCGDVVRLCLGLKL